MLGGFCITLMMMMMMMLTPRNIVLISHFIILFRRSIRLKKGSVAGAGSERKKSEQNESEEGKDRLRILTDTLKTSYDLTVLLWKTFSGLK